MKRKGVGHFMCPHSSELAKATANPLETSDIMIVDNKECRRGNQKRTSQRNWQHEEEKQNKNTTHYYTSRTFFYINFIAIKILFP